jgi:DsbC/DsbD-like thiol-disulfide interchange protein
MTTGQYKLQRDLVCGAIAIFAVCCVCGCQESESVIRSATKPPEIDSAKAKPTGPQAARQLESDFIDPTLTARMSMEPKTVAPGNHVSLIVQLTIQPGWHIAPMAPSAGLVKSTLLTLDLPKGVQAIGDWKTPPPTLLLTGRGKSVGYVDDTTFSQELAVDPGAPFGPVEINCGLSYQVCNESICQRPAEIKLRAVLGIERSPAEKKSH